MSDTFRIDFRKNNGNLYITPSGNLDGRLAWELVNLIHHQYDGQGSVFVETMNLKKINAFGHYIFLQHLDESIVASGHLFFKGYRGFELAPPGCRVLILKNGCCRSKENSKGSCGRCRCKHESHENKETG